MSVIRALVDCVVLSLQDACVFYPCCKSCFSRIDVEQKDTTRCRCSKCGYRCLREQVDYRYRLSLRVSRDRSIFRVTVFGTCLNPFFGIHASGLQRLVENLDGASNRSTLLVKAVEDCFIGRHFIFGIKVTDTESVPWSRGPGSSSNEAVHFIASQMILPSASGLRGCTVVSYYKALLQKAAEYEQVSTDDSKTSRPPATTLLLIRHHFPASSFNDATLSASGLPSQSPQSSQYQDGTLTPTPPWQQSLGLVTSSAEQEDSCSTQDGGDEISRQMIDIRAQSRSLENHEVTEECALSPLPSLACRSPSFAKSPYSSIETVGNTPTMSTWFSPLPAGHNCSEVNDISTRQLSKTCSSQSLAWEDLPFSESLTEYMCGENKDFKIAGETEPHVNVKRTARDNLGISSQDKNLSHKQTYVCQSNRQITNSHMLLDITNTPALKGDRHSCDQVYKSPVECAKKSPASNFWSHECNQEDEKHGSLSGNEEEQLEGDTYNCSADLFNSSVIIDMSTNRPSTHAETVNTTTGACPLPSKPNKQHRRSEKDKNVTPDKRTPKSKRYNNRDSLIPGTQELDFIPPSQSTPIVKVAVVTGRESAKENLMRRTTSSRHGHRFTPERSFWKPDKHRKYLLAQRHLSVQRGALNTGSTEGVDNKCDSGDCDTSVCDHDDNDVFVPPTPAAETRLSVKLRRKQTSSVEGEQGDEGNCKRNLLNQSVTLSQRGLALTGNCDSETADQACLDGSHSFLLEDENETCDWSRDLFSDSI